MGRSGGRRRPFVPLLGTNKVYGSGDPESNESAREHVARLPLDLRCRVAIDLYERFVKHKSRDFAAETKSWMAGCPESYFKMMNEIDKRSKLSS